MFSSVLLFAFTGYMTQAALVVPPASWHLDYSTGLDRAVKDKKPVAIIVGSGLKGWQEISKSGELSQESRRLLDDSFVCVYVDASTESGKKMAGALSVGSGPALVIGDRSGTNMAFRYKGALTQDQLATTLKRFAQVGHVATVTESAVESPTPVSTPNQPYNYPNYFGPGSIGGGCIGGH
jgi:hypothetical protein